MHTRIAYANQLTWALAFGFPSAAFLPPFFETGFYGVLDHPLHQYG